MSRFDWAIQFARGKYPGWDWSIEMTNHGLTGTMGGRKGAEAIEPFAICNLICAKREPRVTLVDDPYFFRCSFVPVVDCDGNPVVEFVPAGIWQITPERLTERLEQRMSEPKITIT